MAAPWELSATAVAVDHPHFVVVVVGELVAVGHPHLAAAALLHLNIVVVVAKPVPLFAAVVAQLPAAVAQELAAVAQELAAAV